MAKPKKPKRRPSWWTSKHRPPKAKAPGHAWPRKTIPKAWVTNFAWWYDAPDREWREVKVAYWLLPDEVKPSTDAVITVTKPYPGGGRLRRQEIYDVPVRELRTKKPMGPPPEQVVFYVDAIDPFSRGDVAGDELELRELLRSLGRGELTRTHYEGPEYGPDITAYFVVTAPEGDAEAVEKALRDQHYAFRRARRKNALAELKRRLMPRR